MLTQLSIRNVGGFRRFDAAFGPGVTGIVGPNGSGKTTVLNAISVLVTGDFRRFGATKAQGVHLLAAKTEPAYVEGHFVQGELEFDVRYSFRGNESSLAVAGEPTLLKQEDIRRRLTEIFGATPEAMALASFKGQGELDDVVRLTPAERSRLLESLCGLSHCEKIAEALGQRVNNDRAAIAAALGACEDPAALAVELAQARTSLAQAQTQAAEAGAKLLSAEGVSKRRRTIDADAAAVRNETLRIAAQLNLQQAEARAQIAQRTSQTATTAAETAGAKRVALQPKLETAQKLAGQAERARKNAQTLALLRSRRDDVAAQLADLGAVSDEDLETALVLEQAAVDRAQTLLATFEAGELVECPTCGTAVAALDHVIAEAKARAQSAQLPMLAAAVRVQRAHRELLRDQAAIEKSLALAEELAGASPSAESVAAAQKFLQAVQAADRELQAARETLSAAKATTTSAAAELKRVKDTLAQMQTLKRPDPALVGRARDDLSAHQLAEKAYLQADADAKAVAAGAAALDRRLTAAQARHAKYRMVGRRCELLEKVRSVFHRTAMPAAVVRGVVEAAEPRLNGWLDLFGSPFTVSFAETSAFQATKPGLPPHPAHLLSAAQRAMLGLAFWLSVPSAGLLALDEPTAFLDAANRAHLGEVLARLGATGASDQVLLTTHATDLGHVLPHTIQLEAPYG